MMLEHLGENEAASLLLEAIEDTIKEGKILTRDLGGSASTQDVTLTVIDKIMKK